MNWFVDRGRLGIRARQDAALSLRGGSGSITVDGARRFLDQAVLQPCDEGATQDGMRRIAFRFNDGISWIWEFQEHDNHLDMFALLCNDSGRDVRVRDWNVLHAFSDSGGGIDLGREPDQVRFLRWKPWDMRVERFAAAQSAHDSITLCHLFDPASGRTALMGFVSLDRMESSHHLRYRAGAGIVEYRATCSFGEYRLRAWRTLQSETLRIGYFHDPYQALDTWADEVHERYQPRFDGTVGVTLTPGTLEISHSPQGVLTNAPAGKRDDWADIFIGMTEVVEKKLKGFGVKSITGGTHRFLKHGLPGNWLHFDKLDYAGGYPALLKYVREMGYGFKFWFSPFWFFGEAEGILDENRENLIVDVDGKPITRISRQGGWEFARGPYLGKDLTRYYLDGTHPKTRDYLRRVFRAYRELGARAYMLDFLSIIPGARLHDDSLLPLEAARKILEVIREAVGWDTHLQTAVASSPGFIGRINSARVVRDYGEARPMHPLPNWRNANYCLHDRHFANAHLFVQNAAAAWFTHRKVYINDLNAMTIDKPFPLEHARITTTVFGLSGESPMVVGDSLRTIAPERLRMLKMCLPRTGGVPVPVDLFDHVAPDSCCHILKKTVETPWDSYMLVAVFNTEPGAGPYNTRIDFSGLGLPEDGAFRVFEFWNEEYIGTYRTFFACTIPPDSCRLYRISKARPHPWLLSTDMHVEQGRAEIGSLSWDNEALVLRGTARRPAGECGSLYVLMPRHLKPVGNSWRHSMKEVIDMQTVLRLPVVFETDRIDFELCFETMDTEYVCREGWLPYATESEWLAYVKEHRDPADTRVIE